MEWIEEFGNGQRCHALFERPVGSGTALALAPHPDDPDVIAVTQRMLMAGGWKISWAVVCSGWSGVEDDYVGADRDAKALAREEEERAAARLFGLSDDRVTFLRLTETDGGLLADTEENRQRFFESLDIISPDLALLPNREDHHPDHRLCYAWFAGWASGAGKPVIALGNEDPKTTDFCPDLQVVFGEETAAWKGNILECHRSQSQRNQHVRDITFAERILSMNRACCGIPGMYAERFQVERWP